MSGNLRPWFSRNGKRPLSPHSEFNAPECTIENCPCACLGQSSLKREKLLWKTPEKTGTRAASVDLGTGWIGDRQGLGQPECQPSAAFQMDGLLGSRASSGGSFAGISMHKKARGLKRQNPPVDIDCFQRQPDIPTVASSSRRVCRLHPPLHAGAARDDCVPFDENWFVYHCVKSLAEARIVGNYRVFQADRDECPHRQALPISKGETGVRLPILILRLRHVNRSRTRQRKQDQHSRPQG